MTLSDLECVDNKYNVSRFVTLDWPWVSKGEAQEILDIENSLAEAVMEYFNETRD